MIAAVLIVLGSSLQRFKIGRVRTHYDNLKVAENAPPEVIRAAYRALAQKYHPDVNPGDAQAAQIMLMLNDANDVLSNPRTRAEYDRKLALQRRASSSMSAHAAYPTPSPQAPSHSPARQPIRTRPRASASGPVEIPFFRLLRDHPLLPVTAVVLCMVFFSEASRQYRSSPASVIELAAKTSGPDSPFIFKSPAKAPNGEPWPVTSGYLAGIPSRAFDGRSTVQIDNRDNVGDVHVKLVSLSAQKPGGVAIRECLVKAGGTFALSSVSPGRYEVRFRDLGHRYAARTDAFDLVELLKTSDAPGSMISFTLTSSGLKNKTMHRLDETQF